MTRASGKRTPAQNAGDARAAPHEPGEYVLDLEVKFFADDDQHANELARALSALLLVQDGVVKTNGVLFCAADSSRVSAFFAERAIQRDGGSR